MSGGAGSCGGDGGGLLFVCDASGGGGGDVVFVVVVFACGGGGGGGGGEAGMVFECGGKVGDEAALAFGNAHSDDSLLAFDGSGEGSDVMSVVSDRGLDSPFVTGAVVGS